jgi:hypothetical protein
VNAIKKLKDMGFKKTQFRKVGYDPDTYESIMVPDDIEIENRYIDGKTVKIQKAKEHPKSDSFWILKYSESCILWCLIKNHQIDKIWIENKLSKKPKNPWDRYKDDERVKLIFDLSNRDSSPLDGRDKIMNLLPKEVKRDFLLEQLFGNNI